MTADDLPGGEPWPERLGVEARFLEWRVLYAYGDRWVRYAHVPAGRFYALHERLSEPPLMASDLEELTALVERRQRDLDAAKSWAERSDLRSILRSLKRHS